MIDLLNTLINEPALILAILSLFIILISKFNVFEFDLKKKKFSFKQSKISVQDFNKEMNFFKEKNRALEDQTTARIMELKNKNDELNNKLQEILMKLHNGLIVNVRKFLLLKQENLYTKCLQKQMRNVRDLSHIAHIDQMKVFAKAFNLSVESEDYKYYNIVAITVASEAVKGFYDLFAENHLSDKAMTNNQSDREKWLRYKKTQITLIWEDYCMKAIREHHSTFLARITRDNVSDLVKTDFFNIYANQADAIFEYGLTSSFEKTKELNNFKKIYEIDIDIDDDEFIKGV